LSPNASQDFTDSHLIESGKFFQRRTVNRIAWTEGAPIRESSLEIAAWPDRLTLWLRVTPQRAIAKGELALVLEAADGFTVAAEPGDVKRDRVEGRSRWTARLAQPSLSSRGMDKGGWALRQGAAKEVGVDRQRGRGRFSRLL